MSSAEAKVWTNVALGKPATQSSLSEWSGAHGAGGLVDGDFSQSFGIHSEIEDNPWWSVDLEDLFPLQAIVAHNRRDGFTDKARTLKIDVSADSQSWTTVHSGICYFEAAGTGEPLRIPLHGKIVARYVRLSLCEHTYLHLSQVEVLVRTDLAALVALRKRLDLDVRFEGESPHFPEPACYRLTSATNDFDAPLTGLSIIENGAFGNCCIQYCLAIALAKRLGLRFIKISERDRSNLIAWTDRVEIDGLTFIPGHEPLPPDGCFLKGNFFDGGCFMAHLNTLTSQEIFATIHNAIRKLFNVLPDHIPAKPRDELAIHIRSGDIFKNWINPDYVQPPLSFYKAIVARLKGQGAITRARMVYEDLCNPVIEPLQDYLRAQGIPFTIHSGSVDSDIAALVNCNYYTFGLGTFGPGVCFMSENIDTVFFFSPGVTPAFATIPSIKNVVEVIDHGGGYIKPGQWQNTEDQRETMRTYPASKLAFPLDAALPAALLHGAP